MNTCSGGIYSYNPLITVIRFFSSSKISLKKYLRKIIFGQTKLNKNNFTSRVWWALIEEITLCAEVMAGEKEIACCVRDYQVYKDIWAAVIREVLVCSTEPTNVGKIFVVKFIRVKYFRTFSVYENIFITKIKRITVAGIYVETDGSKNGQVHYIH